MLSRIKIIKTVATRCQILRLKCTKSFVGWGSVPDPAYYSVHFVYVYISCNWPLRLLPLLQNRSSAPRPMFGGKLITGQHVSSLKTAPSRAGIWTPILYKIPWAVVPTTVGPKNIRIGSAVFPHFSSVFNTETRKLHVQEAVSVMCKCGQTLPKSDYLEKRDGTH